MSLFSETMLVLKRSMIKLYYDTEMIDIIIPIQSFSSNLCIPIVVLLYYWWSSKDLSILSVLMSAALSITLQAYLLTSWQQGLQQSSVLSSEFSSLQND